MTNYDNDFAHDNVYGHALELVVRGLGRVGAVIARDEVHLDVGCGHGAIAEPIVDETGLVYVGFDADPEAVAAVAARDLEAHTLVLADEEATLANLRSVIGTRRVASITMIDVLEHLFDGTATLRALRRIAHEHESVLVLSVPNVTHRDVGFKLAMGDWEYTETGILDTTHTRFFSAEGLERELARGGLFRTARNDVLLEVSDQHFPHSHSVLATGTTLNRLLRDLRAQARPDENTNQFVWSVAPGPISEVPDFITERQPARPFLSIITRTQGRRLHCLREAMVCLAGQTDQDFEVLVMGHRLDVEQQIAVERVIEDVPLSLRERVRLIKVQHGNRVAPLNDGFANALGHYIVILDDDDIPLAHWVETFRKLADQTPGRMLRTVSVLQDIEEADVDGRRSIRSVGAIRNVYPAEFDILAHLRSNFTPNTAIAFPRGVFHDLGMRFDGELTTTEDWDFIMRAVVTVGVASSPEITCIYHWWTTGESSRTVHSQREWERNNGRILRKLDSRPLLLPAGSAARIREVLNERDDARAAAAASSAAAAAAASAPTVVHPRDPAALQDVLQILESRSWRYSAPLRIPTAIFRPSRRVRPSLFAAMSDGQLAHAAAQLRRSRSWRATRMFR